MVDGGKGYEGELYPAILALDSPQKIGEPSALGHGDYHGPSML